MFRGLPFPSSFYHRGTERTPLQQWRRDKQRLTFPRGSLSINGAVMTGSYRMKAKRGTGWLSLVPFFEGVPTTGRKHLLFLSSLLRPRWGNGATALTAESSRGLGHAVSSLSAVAAKTRFRLSNHKVWPQITGDSTGLMFQKLHARARLVQPVITGPSFSFWKEH